eukprot:scaffold12893_cov23-Phaeocystis_antarctica.AAC.1
MPYKPGADPLKEPARPQRDSKPVDRYTATPLDRFASMAQAFVVDENEWDSTSVLHLAATAATHHL